VLEALWRTALLGLFQEAEIGMGGRALAPDQLAELRKMFCLFDSNQNNILERSEMRKAAESCGLASSDLDAIFDSADFDHNGKISFDEFVNLLRTSYT
jgi:Ca2+-binding EF-hand superfamily protein